MRTLIILFTMIGTFFLVSPGSVHAQSIITSNSPIAGFSTHCDFANGNIDAKCVPLFLAHLIRFIFSFAGALCLIMILLAGYKFALGGLPGMDSDGAKTMLRWAIIGLIVSALSFFIINFFIAAIAGP